ncbi:hypothetical protein DNTS_026991 [Danionella cerebrum]|uniref:Uncharacterized protein n=1 Tax=Danionella cerebrum TaxID=2873325 RepID=A0A553N587_9TELE|nr:hypothetical protein DNTS_026991 [Danionella translucida]TRY60585.1 hypothetical protein DNTS_026991 [Danionella translucida]
MSLVFDRVLLALLVMVVQREAEDPEAQGVCRVTQDQRDPLDQRDLEAPRDRMEEMDLDLTGQKESSDFRFEHVNMKVKLSVASIKGENGKKGSSGIKGYKGFVGKPGDSGRSGTPGSPGEKGMDGHRGEKGPPGIPPMPECELVEYIRDNCACCSGNGTRCPLYPTDLVIALDMSAGVTVQDFERMRNAAVTLLQNISIAETNCPWGARVSVISYNIETKNLIRFSDRVKKNSLEEAVKNIAREVTTKVRDIGQAMSYVTRHIFKRVRTAKLLRKVAVFFTTGPSQDESKLATAMLEMKAADITLGVDDTGSYIMVDGRGVNRIKRCIICFDRCNPDPACRINLQPQPLQMDLDLSLLMDGSEDVKTHQYLSAKDLVLSLLDHISVSSEPSRPDGKTRISIYQQSSVYGSSYIHEEFGFTKYTDSRVMKRHIASALKQVGGTSHPEIALEWLISNVLLKVERARSKRMVMAVFSEHYEHSRAQLDYLSKLCKCQNVVMFILMAGQRFDWTRMEELTSAPLEQHLVFLEDREYAVRFIHAYLQMQHKEIIRPPTPPYDCQVPPTEEPREEFTEEPYEEFTEEPYEVFTEEPFEEFTEEPTEEITEEPFATEEPFDEYDFYDEQKTEPGKPEDPDYPFTDGQIESYTEPSKTKARCFQKRDPGRLCGTYQSRWFYSQKLNGCVHFWFGGCDGNENRFFTEVECLEECGSTGKFEGNSESKNLPLISSAFKDLCQLDSDKGSCSEFSLKWYHSDGRCLQFWYGGCGGNKNRFNTQEDCEIRCLRAKKAPPKTSKQ